MTKQYKTYAGGRDKMQASPRFHIHPLAARDKNLRRFHHHHQQQQQPFDIRHRQQKV
jgi:hypothetical protein